jgi:hypothetical protein
MSSPFGQAGFQSGPEEVRVADAGDLVRILEGEEETRAAALIDGHVEDVHAIEQDLAAGDFVVFVAAETLLSVLLPEPFGPMMAWTSPGLIVRFRPLRISRPGIWAWRSLI